MLEKPLITLFRSGAGGGGAAAREETTNGSSAVAESGRFATTEGETSEAAAEPETSTRVTVGITRNRRGGRGARGVTARAAATGDAEYPEGLAEPGAGGPTATGLAFSMVLANSFADGTIRAVPEPVAGDGDLDMTVVAAYAGRDTNRFAGLFTEYTSTFRESRTLLDTPYGAEFNAVLHRRFEEAGSYPSPLQMMGGKLYALAPNDARTLIGMADNCVHIGRGHIYASMVHLRTGSLAFILPGIELGEFLFAKPDFAFQEEIIRKIWHGHYTVFMGTIIYDARRVFHAPDVAIMSYRGGFGSRMYSPSVDVDTGVLAAMTNVALAIPPDAQVGRDIAMPFDIRGRADPQWFSDELPAHERREGHTTYPGAMYYAYLHGFTQEGGYADSYATSLGDGQGYTRDVQTPMCFQCEAMIPSLDNSAIFGQKVSGMGPFAGVTGATMASMLSGGPNPFDRGLPVGIRVG